jgi:phospholipid transport system substrate-binding protein
MARSFRLFVCCSLVAAGLLLGAAEAAAGPARSVVQTLNATFIEVMKNAAALGYAGRYKTLAPELANAYDFPEMARVSAGRYWRELTDAQKQQLTDAFAAYSVATYAARLDGFGGERFEVLGEQPAPADNVRVDNRIVQANGQPIRIDYLLHRRDGEWRIVDVYLKSSVSELAVRRSEFTSVLAKQGFDGLIAALNAKVAALEQGAAARDDGASTDN